jgi:hypothetical protein
MRFIGILEHLKVLTSQSEDSAAFYSSYEINNQSKELHRAFFASSYMREAFRVNGQFMVVDATFNTNCYGFHLLLFSGAFGDMSTVLFGCALIQSENDECIDWACSKFRECMGESIIRENLSVVMTDGHLSYPRLISKHFPSVHHQGCLWHIYKNIEARVRHTGLNLHEFDKMFRELASVRDKDVLEQAWGKLRQTFPSLREVIDDLRRKEAMFSQVHNSKVMNFGAKSSQRGEGMNRVVKKNNSLTKKTTLCQLLLNILEGTKDDYYVKKNRCFQAVAAIRAFENQMETSSRSYSALFSQFSSPGDAVSLAKKITPAAVDILMSQHKFSSSYGYYVSDKSTKLSHGDEEHSVLPMLEKSFSVKYDPLHIDFEAVNQGPGHSNLHAADQLSISGMDQHKRLSKEHVVTIIWSFPSTIAQSMFADIVKWSQGNLPRHIMVQVDNDHKTTLSFSSLIESCVCTCGFTSQFGLPCRHALKVFEVKQLCSISTLYSIICKISHRRWHLKEIQEMKFVLDFPSVKRFISNQSSSTMPSSAFFPQSLATLTADNAGNLVPSMGNNGPNFDHSDPNSDPILNSDPNLSSHSGFASPPRRIVNHISPNNVALLSSPIEHSGASSLSTVAAHTLGTSNQRKSEQWRRSELDRLCKTIVDKYGKVSEKNFDLASQLLGITSSILENGMFDPEYVLTQFSSHFGSNSSRPAPLALSSSSLPLISNPPSLYAQSKGNIHHHPINSLSRTKPAAAASSSKRQCSSCQSTGHVAGNVRCPQWAEYNKKRDERMQSLKRKHSQLQVAMSNQN